jgi:hypothetical protein
MSKALENNLMDNLYLCLKRKKHYAPNVSRNQIGEKSDPQKEVVTPKELFMPKFFQRKQLSTPSARRLLSVIKNYWKK